MNFIDKITGNDMKRAMKVMQIRADQLPEDYQEAWIQLQTYIWSYSDITGRNLMPIFENVLELLEETSSDQLTVEEVFDGDYKGFAQALVGGEGSNLYRDKWRKQLNDNVAKKLSNL